MSDMGLNTEESAYQIIVDTLKFYGLNDPTLLTEIKGLWTNETIGPRTSIDDIGIQLRNSEAFNKRFPANKILKDAQKPQLSVTNYLRLETDFTRKLQENAMPPGFYDDPTDFQNLIAGGVSPNELADRITMGYQAVKNADPSVIAEFNRLYPEVKDGDLAAYFIDPQRARPTFDKYEAQRQAQAASVASQALRQASISLTTGEAEGLIRAGVTPDQAQQKFQQIGTTQELFNPLTGEQAINQADQIAGTFDTNAAARQAITERKRKRQAAFETGGGFAPSQTGTAGLGTVG